MKEIQNNGKLIGYNMMSPETEEKLLQAMAEEIVKEVTKEENIKVARERFHEQNKDVCSLFRKPFWFWHWWSKVQLYWKKWQMKRYWKQRINWYEDMNGEYQAEIMIKPIRSAEHIKLDLIVDDNKKENNER